MSSNVSLLHWSSHEIMRIHTSRQDICEEVSILEPVTIETWEARAYEAIVYRSP
jgi:hypothetical protein